MVYHPLRNTNRRLAEAFEGLTGFRRVVDDVEIYICILWNLGPSRLSFLDVR